ncbi:hypothetical protein Cus16_0722 [Curtobacterium sp. ER1/6]|nr:hypothetical protein Cus16_0722 [Curtobacterium sp. ER1/6]
MRLAGGPAVRAAECVVVGGRGDAEHLVRGGVGRAVGHGPTTLPEAPSESAACPLGAGGGPGAHVFPGETPRQGRDAAGSDGVSTGQRRLDRSAAS